ncbi:glycosyltransferase [Sporolactobacillus spathodeae]|uniref:Glycosyltransferase involved in cell wall biosynthesis n=1 Tax=Sporolactobacillus spathodeae TaxID=1465502 RepID=A0ABS2QCI2_9BACL|nr:glycosyltransferase involved in cell wall biosynthesis [Sporolactobacillus spathodeae]
MPKIAVVRNWFLPISETFIYSELVNLHAATAIVCCKKEMNQDQFPFDPVFKYKSNEALSAILRKEHIALIHARFGLTGADLLQVKQELGMPMLTSFHGFDLPTNVKSMQKYKGRLDLLFQEGEAFTVTSKNMKKILVAYGCPESKIFVHHSGIEIEKFPFRDSIIPENSVITILSVGRLVPKKGMNDLIEAFNQVQHQWPNVRLRIAGEGPLRHELVNQVKRLNLDQTVTFLGALSYEDIRNEMQQAQVFALASVTTKDGNQEGIPNVLKEALATGLPVVSTRHAGIPELIRNGESGILVPEHDTAGLAQALLKLIKNPDQWKPMAKQGRKTVTKLFNAKKQVDELENIYQKVIEEFNQRGKEQTDDANKRDHTDL